VFQIVSQNDDRRKLQRWRPTEGHDTSGNVNVYSVCHGGPRRRRVDRRMNTWFTRVDKTMKSSRDAMWDRRTPSYLVPSSRTTPPPTHLGACSRCVLPACARRKSTYT